MKNSLRSIGIDDMAFYVPKIYLNIHTLAEARNLAAEKLTLGLGLQKMALPDAHEDAATMAAEAIAELLVRNNLDPRRVGRIYMGTESALDMAKPTATYAVGMVQDRLAPRWGEDCFRNCDVLDMTFACIGATDALQNSLDWVSNDRERIAIVVASDIAKYELGSTGEYTQGAGAVAMLLRWNPRLLAIRNLFGTAMESVHDFYKPRRERFTETPVFDGQFSNACYQSRMVEAIDDFRAKALHYGVIKEGTSRAISDRWARMIFHLPYAFHAKRMYVEQFVRERKMKQVWANDVAKYGFQEPDAHDFSDKKSLEKALANFFKKVSESALYQRFVREKLEKAQRASSETGNLYTASIFLALMSTLEADLQDNSPLTGKKLGFVAYGSGSKAKVFEAVVQKEWKEVVRHFHVFDKLKNRRAVDYAQYEALHNGTQEGTVLVEKGRWGLSKIGTEGNLLGARYYGTH